MRFSVVIPTYQRRDTVVRNVQALERQTQRDFEVIVVVDGSTDGTAEALGRLDLSFALTVHEQPNRGQASARNAGAAVAQGELLLFLDDDMEADPALLAEHDRSRREGVEFVLGHVPLHPASPPNLLSWGAGLWADARKERLDRSGRRDPYRRPAHRAVLDLPPRLRGTGRIRRELHPRRALRRRGHRLRLPPAAGRLPHRVQPCGDQLPALRSRPDSPTSSAHTRRGVRSRS